MKRSARDVLFGPGGTGRAVGDTGLLLLRVFAGLALAFAHGLGKIPPAERFVGMIGGFGFPAPQLLAWLSGITEFFGGIMLALGLLTRPVAVFIIINLSVALIFAHAGDPFARRELPLLFAFVALLFALAGPGRYSLDALLGRGGAARGVQGITGRAAAH